MFYRLYDKQTGGYMATGLNTTSHDELAEEYVSYKSLDVDDEEDGYENLSTEEVIDRIKGDDFEIEESEEPFPDDSIDINDDIDDNMDNDDIDSI